MNWSDDRAQPTLGEWSELASDLTAVDHFVAATCRIWHRSTPPPAVTAALSALEFAARQARRTVEEHRLHGAAR